MGAHGDSEAVAATVLATVSLVPRLLRREDGADHLITGERAGAPPASCVWPGAWSPGAVGLHAVLGGTIEGRAPWSSG
jgi:hypothetical protein